MIEEPELNPAAVGATLTTAWLGRAYRYAAELDSTNDQMKRWAAEGAPQGAVLLADYQSAGRGRLDRRWDAPQATSLLLSVLLRPAGWPAERGAWLTMLAGLAVAEAIKAVAGLPARLKWPNDVLIEHDGQWRKVCGLLLDATLDGERLATAIVGIGLNVNVPAGDLAAFATPATSLLAAGGRPVARRPLLAALLARLEHAYDAADAGQSPAAAWSARLQTLGQAVTVSAAGSAVPLAGVAEGVDEWGRLLVRDAAGRRHTITAGDVTLRTR
jgi:BirA family biotin operon repressor/biotin-[acetyl-CoA-carboxylase] ligase